MRFQAAGDLHDLIFQRRRSLERISRLVEDAGAVEEHAGRVVKSLGDGILASFNFPHFSPGERYEHIVDELQLLARSLLAVLAVPALALAATLSGDVLGRQSRG